MIVFIYSNTVYTYCNLMCNCVTIFWVKKGKSAQSLCTPDLVITLVPVTEEPPSTWRRAKGLVCRGMPDLEVKPNFFLFYDDLYKTEELSIEIPFEFVSKTNRFEDDREKYWIGLRWPVFKTQYGRKRSHRFNEK